ncbi:dynein regulatory complex protein 8 [Drosophila pseudoobscura]|uniref:Dynein regulatory complex protein 8 n=1 Tax=Drosophila pseudoobscura pseudoobscura TaxID=46245 RepID=A0A6I8UVW6_DROPS|nr:dynein regulatory complex protein 8 [Drosophila pseudoobscura]
MAKLLIEKLQSNVGEIESNFQQSQGKYQVCNMDMDMNNDLEKRISDAFCVFDHHGDKFIDVREVGTVLRLLGCVPTEEEVNEVISATESEETSGEVHLTKFLPHVSQLLMERKMEPAPPEKILQAFKILDPENKGYLAKETFGKLMMEEGEPFTQEEMDEMWPVAIDPISGHIPYEFYLNQLMVYL